MSQRNDVKGEELRERSSEEIRQDIFERRESLLNTVDRLGGRIQEKLDWREQVSQHPFLVMGAAAGVGFLLSRIFKPSPTPGKRIMDALDGATEDLIDTVRNSFQGLFHKIRPDMIMMLTTIILQVGGNFLLTKIKKNTSDYKKNGSEVHNEEVTHGKE